LREEKPLTRYLRNGTAEQIRTFSGHVKTGRTHEMDYRPTQITRHRSPDCRIGRSQGTRNKRGARPDSW